ncbi:hypothetical protein EPH95_07435 [Salicibibacter halophilus]|uniref:SPOR domain-containing protein n=1 Tax=Salicibibacter halophilus TaxID=2502791 RepID=A0A514LHL5_9BACI|nr:hypothetical protein [Salicibibacter halophilus]QDI91035.1 hypothetical protein EPH95_07435 [Salicibibacter halophilus]
MGQGHRKITFKINGKEITRSEETVENRENTKEKNTGKEQVSEEKKELGPALSGKDAGGDIKDRGRERHEVVDLSEKRKEWAERDRKPITNSPGLPLHRKKKKPGAPFPRKRGSFKHLKIPVTIAAALIVGLIFGLPLLHLATNFSLTSDAGTAGNVSGNQTGSMAVDEEETEQMQLDIVQAGAFDTNEAGQEMQEVFAEAGFPALLHEDEEMIYLYVGMTAQGEANSEVIPEIEEEGLEGYVKTLSVPVPSEGMDEETEQLARDTGEALLTGLEATGSGGDEKEAEEALMDMNAIEGEGSQESERFSETIQALHEEGNAEDHEAWMEATMEYENWMNSF